MAQKVETIMSQKEHVNIIVDGFVFQRPNKVINDDLSTAWRCQEARKLKCTSTCAIDKDGCLKRPPTEHNHDKPAPEKLNANIMKYNSKKGAEKSLIFLLRNLLKKKRQE